MYDFIDVNRYLEISDIYVKNNSDFVEQRNYENTIKKNFASSFVRKLKLDLLSK